MVLLTENKLLCNQELLSYLAQCVDFFEILN